MSDSGHLSEQASCEHEWRLFKQDVVDYDRGGGTATFLRTRTFYCVRCREVVTDTDSAVLRAVATDRTRGDRWPLVTAETPR